MTRISYIRIDAYDRVVGGGKLRNTPSDSLVSRYIQSDADLNAMLNSETVFVWDGAQFVDTGESKTVAPYFVWSKEQNGWIDGRDLDQKKADKWVEIKAARDAQEFSQFDWGGYTFQCDEVSQRRIQGAVQLSAIDDTLTLDWTLADNSVQNFTASEYVQIGVALATHVSGCHARGRILRQEIESATTETELEAIVW